MKFKGLVIGILTAMLLLNIFTAYELISESKKQTSYQRGQLETQLAIADLKEQEMKLEHKNEPWGDIASNLHIERAQDILVTTK